MMVPFMMLGTVVAVAKSREDEKKVETVAITEERKLLPEGRQQHAR